MIVHRLLEDSSVFVALLRKLVVKLGITGDTERHKTWSCTHKMYIPSLRLSLSLSSQNIRDPFFSGCDPLSARPADHGADGHRPEPGLRHAALGHARPAHHHREGQGPIRAIRPRMLLRRRARLQVPPQDTLQVGLKQRTNFSPYQQLSSDLDFLPLRRGKCFHRFGWESDT